MNFSTLFPFLEKTFWLALVILSVSGSDGFTQLPVPDTAQNPEILLELGKESALSAVHDHSRIVFNGQVSNHDETTSIQEGKDEISSLHSGFGHWTVGFRFNINPGLLTKPHRFKARWKQGGEPDVCVQSFEIWAGPESKRLEKRSVVTIKPKGWDYAWLSADEPIIFKADDTVIEVRNSGAGHDAKVFDAFLLSPVLPIQGSTDNPLVLLELGSAPFFASMEKDPAVQVQTGTAAKGPGTDSLLTERDEVQLFHQGFGTWNADFRFELTPAVMPGIYQFFARYKTGGEESQVSQKFTIKAGPKPDDLSMRGDFVLTNTTPWEYQWMQANGGFKVFPGDRWLEISNSGKADGAKVFDAFLLQKKSQLDDWMDTDQAQARHRFLALIQAVPDAPQRLYVLDGKGNEDVVLFSGLVAEGVRQSYKNLAVTYLTGQSAEIMAQSLNLSSLPAAVMTDDHYSILGVLTQPENEADVAHFLTDPAEAGFLPPPAKLKQSAASTLSEGVPAAWLVGGLQAGLAGVSNFGIDNETVLRPNPDQPYLSLQMMGGEMKAWRIARTQAGGVADIETLTGHSYLWSRGSGYAQLYLHADKATTTLLHLKQSGIVSQGWLDGKPFNFTGDLDTPSGVSKVQSGSSQVAELHLPQGWHSLLIKMVMQHEQGQRFNFAALFTDQSGRPINNMLTQLTDPNADLELNKIATRLRPLIFVEAPANLPHPGEMIKLRVDMRWHPILEETSLPVPLPRFKAQLRLRLVDYSGNDVAVREVEGLFPGQIEVDFGKLEHPGYYAVYSSLHTPDGRLIMNYPADGFSVVRGNAAQKLRLDRKKLWNNNYYALADGDKSFMQQGGYFSWLERMGIFKSVGSYPGFDTKYKDQWEDAKQRGLILFADSSGDSPWLNDHPEEAKNFINQAGAFTRFFKSTNEIDIRLEPEWQKLRDPAHWVERAKREYEQAHQRRSDAHYVGGSLVRPGDKEGAGQWFRQVLQLGLDQYQDAWDIHAYPQNAPRFEGPIGNSDVEGESGVFAAYADLGSKNRLPFWLGETGAKVMHGSTGRRWQAEQVAKMIAWVNSRSNYLGLAFCIGYEYDLAYGRIWDYSMGHKPGEAALYTAGALIDGLSYKAIDTKDDHIQAAYFGETFMIWRADEVSSTWQLPLDEAKSWVLVDVVGRQQALTVNASGLAEIPISSSPVYVLTRSDYDRLTQF
ncbi:hypothetical protein [Methylicorpusculum sp.]|uniref:hypothetical protein n=1 Tax=Methylicorpusculum sp. TaxID=2713644 RepID=UPI00272F7972|nr:hypothetical protein [Methylicorpusculum sp.]MDP2179052.1 hypothetical protein [Methylicorpusculum sp.]MDP3529666.1 hypothetical protein [Methylicorpusculum sp.]